MIKKSFLLFTFANIFFLFIYSSNLFPQGFLHRENTKIVNGSGQEVLLKGLGLGGWLLQEGYMLQTSGFANAQWEIKAKILDLVGEANTEQFYETYRNNFVKKIDIEMIKSWGFNSVRLPFHYNLFATNTNPPVFLNKGFEIVDSLLQWCKANQIYLILDMHAAPGGQSDEPISDYNSANPSLWQSEQNKNLTVQIWRKIAERYKDEEWIGGYDLLNEPKWNLPPNNQPLRDLYIRLTDTIRAVDNNHLLFIEGNWFATDFSGLTPAWDDNMSYSFHKYWNQNNQSSIQYLIDLRNSTNRPLWLGETGENSNKWFTDCAELMKSNNIGWAWWPLKKISSISGPLSSYLLPAYQTLLNYWGGSGSRPSVTYAMNALMAQANELLFENCNFQPDVIDALIRQPNNTSTVPYTQNNVPGIVHATDYNMGQLNYAYKDVDYENTGNGSWNSGWSYRNDGVDIESCSDFSSNGYNVGWIETGEWLKYSVSVSQSGYYDINFNVAAQNAGGKILIKINGVSQPSQVSVPATGGYQNWQTASASNVLIPAGSNTFDLWFISGGFNLSYMDFVLTATDVKTDITNPNKFALEQNYPNPFNPKTTIFYSIKNRGNVLIKVFNLLGNEVATLINEEQSAGKYSLNFDADNYKLSSGIYFYRIETPGFTSQKKMIVLK